MGIKMSKDKKMIRDAVRKCKHELEVIHQKYMLGVGENRELYHRRIDYAQGLKVCYEQLEKELTCDVPVRFEIFKEPFGLTLVITKGSIKVKEFVNYSPYYMLGNNIDTTPVKEQMEMPDFLRRYVQYC
jgi:ribosome-associated toxin RatA of RatAB toxin-antitoxin module